jgi:hypothetical protein
VEVEIEGRWRRLDSFINDLAFYRAGTKALREKGWDTGYSISCSSGESSPEFNVEEEKFVQMDAVVADHGLWDDPSDYYRTDRYRNRPGPLKMLLYRFLIRRVNARVARMRSAFCEGLERGGGK